MEQAATLLWLSRILDVVEVELCHQILFLINEALDEVTDEQPHMMTRCATSHVYVYAQEPPSFHNS